MKKILIVILVFTFFYSKALAGEDYTGATIKDMTSNIQILEEKKEELNLSENLGKEYDDLKFFLKENISNDELEILNKKLKEYIIYSQESEEKIIQNPLDEIYIEEIKNQVLIKRLDLYKFIYKYIDLDKEEDFISYVESNIISSKEKKDLLEDITKQKTILEEKVKNLQEKIQDNKETLNSSIDDLITSKIIERINQIDNNEQYSSISQETKNTIYQNYINTLNIKLEEIQNSNLSESYKELRIKIITKMIEEISNKIKE